MRSVDGWTQPGWVYRTGHHPQRAAAGGCSRTALYGSHVAPSETSSFQGRSTALRAVVAAVLLEALILVGVAVFFVVEIFIARPADAVAAAVIAVLALLLGGFLGICARALWRGNRWGRSPVITWQLLMVLGVVPSLMGERWYVAVPLLTLCLVAGGGLLLPVVVRETTGSGEPPAL